MQTKEFSCKKSMQSAIILFLLQTLACMIVCFMYGFIYGFLNAITNQSSSNGFSSQHEIPLIFLMAIVICNFLFVQNRCKQNSSDITPSTIKIISLGISIINAIIVYIFNFKFLLANSFNYKMMGVTFLLTLIILFSYLFNYSSLSLANSFFNKKKSILSKFTIFSAMLLPLLVGITVYAKLISTIDKDTWSKNFKNSFNSIMCDYAVKDATVKSKHITYSQCMSLMSESVNRCMTKMTTPDKIQIQNTRNLGREIGKCAADDFYDRNLN